MRTRTSIFLLASQLALSVAGCDLVGDLIAEKVSEKVTEKVAEEVIENALEGEGENGKAEVDLSSGKVEVKTDKGKMTYGAGEDVEIPKSFPSDVVLPDQIKVKMAIEAENTFNVMAESTTEPGPLAEKMMKDAESNGWKKKSDMNMGHARILAYEKDKRTLAISIANNKEKKPDNPTTVLNINIQTKKK